MDIPTTDFSALNSRSNQSEETAELERFFVRYRSIIFRWCFRRLRNRADAEDVTQEIMIKLIKSLPSHAYDPSQARFRSWLKAVVNNAVTDLCRSRQRSHVPQSFGGTSFLECVKNVVDDHPDSDQTTSTTHHPRSYPAEVIGRVRAVVSPKSWDVFTQMTLEERPAAQIARDSGITVGSVYKIVFRVKQRLHKELEHERFASPVPATQSSPTVPQ